MQRAENEGIYIIQINMVRSIAARPLRRQLDRDRRARHRSCREGCEGKSNKIAVVAGPCRRGIRLHPEGCREVLAKHPEVKVVSSQAADWDASKAKAIVQTRAEAASDLCGIVASGTVWISVPPRP